MSTDDPFTPSLPHIMREAAIAHDTLALSHSALAALLCKWEAALVAFLASEGQR